MNSPSQFQAGLSLSSEYNVSSCGQHHSFFGIVSKGCVLRKGGEGIATGGASGKK